MTIGESPNDVVLTLADVRAGYGPAEVVRGVDLTIESGEVVSIVGPNGAGKSTLLGAITGGRELFGGVITWRGEVASRWTPRRFGEHGCVRVIDGQVTFAPMTVRENLELGSRALGRAPNSGTLAEVYTLFPVLQNRQAQRAGTLSGGEKKMLAIGRALMAEPTVLILDEATAGLAPRIINEIGDALRALSAGGLTLLLAEQSLQLPSRLGGRAVLMERGLFTWSGLAASLKSEQRVVEAVLGHGIVDVGAEPGFTQTV